LIYLLVYFLLMPPTQEIIGRASLAINFIRMLNVLGLYLKDIALPMDLATIDPMTIFNSWAILCLGISGFLGAALVILNKNKLNPAISFSVIWFFLWLLPMNNFLNSFRILAAYRYIYFSITGFAVLLGFLLSKIWQQGLKNKLLRKFAPFACYGYFAIFCVSANATWKDDLILGMSLVEKNPASVFAHLNMGSVLSRYGNYPEARKEFEIVLSHPDFIRHSSPLYISIINCNLGAIYMLEGDYKKAEQFYLTALKSTPHLAHIYAKLGYCYAWQGEYDKALEHLSQAKKINPRFSPAYLNTGITYILMNRYNEARVEFIQALAINPKYQEASNYLKKLEKSEKGQE